MTPLAWVSITDFVVSGEAFFLAGLLVAKTSRLATARGAVAALLLFLGFASFFAAVDHGFIQGRGFLPDVNIVTHISWVFVGLLTAAMLAIVTFRYFPRQRWLLVVGAVQFIVFAIFIASGDQYILVSANAAPELILGLVVSLVYVRQPGSAALAASAALIILGSVIQAAGFGLSDALNHDTLYHLAIMAGAASTYATGRKFNP